MKMKMVNVPYQLIWNSWAFFAQTFQISNFEKPQAKQESQICFLSWVTWIIRPGRVGLNWIFIRSGCIFSFYACNKLARKLFALKCILDREYDSFAIKISAYASVSMLPIRLVAPRKVKCVYHLRGIETISLVTKKKPFRCVQSAIAAVVSNYVF